MKDNGKTSCTLCRASADPIMALLTRTGAIYSLCEGCTPAPGQEKHVADKCRETKLPPQKVGEG